MQKTLQKKKEILFNFVTIFINNKFNKLENLNKFIVQQIKFF